MRILLTLILLQISFTSYATYKDGQVDPKRATTSEMLRLPKLCQLRFQYGLGGKKFSAWKTRLGPDALHVHHYCEGLVAMFRADARDKHRKSHLNSAKANFNYILRYLQNPNYILLPDTYYRLSIVAKEQGNTIEAINFATKSIQAKKNYLNPYLLLSDIYIKSGNKTEAKNTLLQAQQYHPNSKSLKKRLKEIN